MEILHGDIVYSENEERLSIHEDSYIAVDRGTVQGIFPGIPEQYRGVPVTDYGRKLIIPAFSDLHIHAPQYAQRGRGMDLLLPDWLRTYTFPEESKFADLGYARQIYSLLADDMIRNGTFHASVFATIHNPATLLLAEILEKRGICGFVGKVNMDRNSPDYLCETTEQSLRNTEEFLSSFAADRRVQPILTPRFAPTCSRELMYGLGKLAARYGCGVQSHFVESRWEAAEAVKLFPECSCDTEIYKMTGLLEHGKSIMAHFIFPSETDLAIAKQYDCVAVHCPDATNNVIAGIAPISDLTEQGVHLAMGTDIGAGQSTAVYKQIASAVKLSKLREFYEGRENGTISFPQAFCMATRGGGSVFGRYGSFEVGDVFDALVLDGLEDPMTRLSVQDRLERFCYSGDDRNIAARYIAGKLLLSRYES